MQVTSPMSHDVQEREPVWQPAKPNPVKESKAWALARQLPRGKALSTRSFGLCGTLKSKMYWKRKWTGG